MKAHLWPDSTDWSYERLAAALAIAPSQAHASLRRMSDARLFRLSDRSVAIQAFVGFAAHGIPHVFPGKVGEHGFGMPTAHSAPPLCQLLTSAEAYVWPAAKGIPGCIVEPLHPCVPQAAAGDPAFYQAVALIDALRVGRVRDRRLATDALRELLAFAARDTAWATARREASVSA